MKLNQYLKLAYANQLFGKRSWRIQISCKVLEGAKTTPFYPQLDDVGYFFIDHNGDRVDIEAPTDKPLATWKQEVTLEPGDLPGITEKTETRYGVWLVNVIGFTFPYDGKVKYINKGMFDGDLHNAYVEAISAGIITSRADLNKGVNALETLFISDAELGVKSSSRTMMEDDVEGDKLRQQMIEEYGDHLNDPIIQAEFDKRLIEHKKKLVKTSGAKDFYGEGGKLYNTVMMKTDGRYGSEQDTDGNPTEFIIKSLNEGLDLDKMESWVNASITGSFSRGALTALSGAEVKEVLRATATLTVSDLEDCGTKVGWTVIVTSYNYKFFANMYLLKTGKDAKPLSQDELKGMVGSIITLRAPSGCLETNLTYCRKCMGTYTTKDGIPMGVARLDSIMMLKQMKAAHGYSVEARLVDLNQVCS